MGPEERPAAAESVMHVLHVKYDEMIPIHERELLFRFQVSEALPGKVHLDIWIPATDAGVRFAVADVLERETVEIGDPLVLEGVGNEAAGIEEGTVEINVVAVEGDTVTV
jgi:hypothetical protein